MPKYSIKINPENEDKLYEIGEITYAVQLIKGLYFVESALPIEDIRKLDFIDKVELEMQGKLCI